MSDLGDVPASLSKRYPAAMRLLVFAIILAAPLIAMAVSNTWIRILDFALIYVLLALGLNLVVGFAGLLDLGYIAFYAVGAYLFGFFASPHFGLHWPFWLLLPMGAVVAASFGVLLGFPTLRLRGDYLAIVTLGFGEIIRIFINNLNQPINITGGPQGIDGIDPLEIGGFSFADDLTVLGVTIPSLVLYYYVFAGAVLLSVVLIGRLRVSRVGRAWAAIRDDELAAKSIGVNTRNFKLLAFAMGASFGGVAGGLFAAFQGFISPESFSLTESIAIVTMIVLGGMGNLAGVIVGALLLSALPEVLRDIAEPVQTALFDRVIVDPDIIRLLLLSLAMILMMLLKPAGLLPAHSRYARRYERVP
jgi:branched-chain amino acid transport system permease protein